MHIGLIGGIGPAATIAYYRRLCRAVAETGQSLELTIVQADTKTVMHNTLCDARTTQAEAFARLIDRLRMAGAECAAITSIGGHFCFAETVALSSLPLVSAVAPLDRYFAAQGIGTVGLLGTAVVMHSRLYGQLKRTRAVAPASGIDSLGQLYFEMAMQGHCHESTRRTFFDAGRSMIESMGAEAIMLAGTDLGLAFDGQDPGFPVIDALDVHVAVLADLATGRQTIDALRSQR